MNKKRLLALLLAAHTLFMVGCKNNSKSDKEDFSVSEKTIRLPKDSIDMDELLDKSLLKEAKKIVESLNGDANYQEYDLAYIKDDTSILSSIVTKEEIGKIEKYQRVIILKKYNDFVLIKTLESNCEYGFVKNDFLVQLPESFVEVDISDQVLYFFKNKNLELVSEIVTGNKDVTPTDEGYFNIFSKAKGTYLVGPTWNSYVNYWMEFNAGSGLHDAPWRSEFGGSIYDGNGSHGCVNLPYDVAQKLYEETDYSTKVLIHK